METFWETPPKNFPCFLPSRICSQKKFLSSPKRRYLVLDDKKLGNEPWKSEIRIWEPASIIFSASFFFKKKEEDRTLLRKKWWRGAVYKKICARYIFFILVMYRCFNFPWFPRGSEKEKKICEATTATITTIITIKDYGYYGAWECEKNCLWILWRSTSHPYHIRLIICVATFYIWIHCVYIFCLLHQLFIRIEWCTQKKKKE